MAVVEFDNGDRTYRVDLPAYDASNVHSINLIRDKVTLSTDMITGEKLFVSWSQITVLRIVS